MAVREELVDPGTPLIAGAAAGVAWAVGLPVTASIAVGIVALVARVSLGVVLDEPRGSAGFAPSAPRAGSSRAELPIRERSSEDRWVRRSETAVGAIERLAASFRAGAVAAQMEGVAAGSRGALAQIRALAGQASATKEAARHLDPSRLAADVARLTARIQRADGQDHSSETQRSLDAVRDQLAIYRRLEQARQTLLARIEAGALGLQHLAAQIAELAALAGDTSSPEDGVRIGELAQQLEALRSGMAEAEALSRSALTEFGDGRRD